MATADLNQMLVFARVVSEGSFTAAARVLAQPKSTVSKRVAQLEARLGVRLLQRSTRKVKPTADGATYYELCRRITADIEEADRAMIDRVSAPHGLVRMAAPMVLGSMLGSVTAEFVKQYPGVSLEVSLSDRVVDLIDERFDVAVRVGPLRDSSLVVRRLVPTDNLLCASPEYLAQQQPPRHPEDLVKHQCVLFRPAPGKVAWTFVKRGRKITVPVAGRYAASALPPVRDAALAGLGIAAVPRVMVEPDLAAGHLVPVLTAWPLMQAEIHLLFPSGLQKSPRVRALVDLIVAAFEAYRKTRPSTAT